MFELESKELKPIELIMNLFTANKIHLFIVTTEKMKFISNTMK